MDENAVDKKDDLKESETEKEKIYQNFDIKHLFGKKNLEDIQNKIAKATGLAFVTVDYKGEPVTELTSFTTFCQTVRKDKEAEKICRSSDAFGAIQAAVTQKTSVYLCPCGLIEVAIPIIVRGHYLGGFIGGQIRCLDAPDDICRLETVMHHKENYKETKKDLYQSILVLKYQQFINVADLVSMIINQLGEKELSRLMQKDISQREMERFQEKEKKMNLEYDLKASELAALKSHLNPLFLLRNLNAISNLAVIEKATRTNEMVNLFSDFVRNSISNSKKSVTLIQEMENVERYLKIQQIRFGESLHYNIHLPTELHMQKIPGSLLLPFIEKSIFCGIGLNAEGGTLKIDVSLQNGQVIVQIADTGPGLDDEQIAKRFLPYRKSGYEQEEIESGITTVKRRLAVFGSPYGVTKSIDPKRGTKYTIVYPQNFDEKVM